jgi:hypothetical protein
LGKDSFLDPGTLFEWLNGSTFYDFEKPLLAGEVFSENGLSGQLQEELVFFRFINGLR